jgi:hypothetical protein
VARHIIAAIHNKLAVFLIGRDIETRLFGKIERKAFGAAKSNANMNISHFNKEFSIFGLLVFMLCGHGDVFDDFRRQGDARY